MPSLEDLSHEELLKYTAGLQQSDALFAALLKSPDTREDTLRLMKKKNPNMILPELDGKDATMKALEEEREERKKLEARLLEKDISDRIEKQREQIKKEHEFTDADMLEVEKIMTDKDKGVLNYAAAARVYKAERTPSEPTAFQVGSPTYDMPDAKVWAGGIGNKAKLDKIFMQEATAAVNEILKTKAA